VVSFHGLLQSEPTNIFADPNFDGTVNEEGCVNDYATKCQVLIKNPFYLCLCTHTLIHLYTKGANRKCRAR
jgi:hypothetical protein